MKRPLFLAAILVFTGAAFLAGYWYKTVSSPVTASPPAAVGEQSEHASMDDMSSTVPGTVQVRPGKQQLMGITLATVEKVSEKLTLRLLGRVVPDETRIYRVNAAVDGSNSWTLPLSSRNPERFKSGGSITMVWIPTPFTFIFLRCS